MTAIDGAGTAERSWRPFLAGLDLPSLGLDDLPARVVVVAPHPDDEVLGAGGLLTLLAAAGARIELLAVTDGEASNVGGSVPPALLAARRTAETAAALDVLAPGTGSTRLHLPDGGRGSLEEPVVDALRLAPGTWLLGPWAGDGHPDHEAVGRGCARVAERDAARLLAYPVWTWHWAAPGDARVPWERAVQVDLAPAVRARKARAIASFVSQTQPQGPLAADAPVLPPEVLVRFSRPCEILFT